MKENENILALAKQTLEIEASSISRLIQHLDEGFTEAVKFIHQSKGRIVITGIGKSANIANKIVATLNSTGSPAIFMHAADAVHGDLGNIQENDVVICISNSGNTPEIKVLVPFIKQMGNTLVAFTGNYQSFLAQQADFVIYTGVEKEACTINMAPTSSTTAQLAMGDALAVCLLNLNGFTENDFAKFHPGGALGKKMYLRVADLMALNQKPAVQTTTSIKDLIIEISSKRLGITAVLENNKLVGVVTDGDLRRMLHANETIQNITAEQIMTKNPKTIDINELAFNALEMLKKFNITQILVTNKGNYAGVVHLHDLMREGII